MNLGLGKMGEVGKTYHRKFRWLFQGFSDSGKLVFNDFVKPLSKPEVELLDFVNIKRVKSGHLDFNLVLMCPEERGKKLMQNVKLVLPYVAYATLSLLDGSGCVLEDWDFDCVETKMISESYENVDLYGCNLGIRMTYEHFVYNAHWIQSDGF